MASQSSLFEHRTIGPIRGISKIPGVTQFLGVQYATLRDRFSRGELLKAYPATHPQVKDGVLDATKLGPLPLSPVDGCAWEHKLIQCALPAPEFEQSDIDCLTLNIAVPGVQDNDGPSWPVLALVHGGAFATGSSSYPQYDLGRIVRISVDLGKPVIAVGINYRLGVPGFLHSAAMNSAGYKPNNGLNDQRLGLLWIQQNIAGFHGDPHRVTYIGESSGAASGCFHLHSPEPLFSQLITMSGTSLIKAKPLEGAERSFQTAIQLLNPAEASSLSNTAQVQLLLDTPMADIRDKIGRKVPLGPVVDGEMIPRANSFVLMANPTEAEQTIPGTKWCKRILMGDCQMDGNAYAPRLAARKDILPHTLATYLAATLDPIDSVLAPKIVSGYGLQTSATTNTPESTKAVLDFATDICFALGARAFARSWSAKAASGDGHEAFLYRFNVPNPWDGPWKGHATHILDIAFVLQNYREQLSPGQQKTGDLFARHIVEFVNGEKPWAAYQVGSGEGSMVYCAPEQGDEDESYFTESEDPTRTGGRDVLQGVAREPAVLDAVMTAWEKFMKGPLS
ncbi:Alpha/Beta hydrolase protein [Podospora aff. communis PSN243]|uniref:Alpha/Beta hydrolase protein n=1 Tax=Podospora aff. communis PSN243 TaxID=3040156 RepID=A0AAV9GII9_9PEZI|nr:Alpha/Beta hydrolase protein [Podospora aff. communis PSN243]